ncbi:MAG: NAD-dependent epimerase/dehydratase family protein [Salinibacterium sp.]|nr:NAD-dependent epimerase/dehydratase family protein [Salinibacterium sp.]
MTKYLVTGCAGFVGGHVTQHLIDSGAEVIGIDGLRTELYGADPKLDRIAELREHPRFGFARLDLRSDSITDYLDGVEVVLHFAALAGPPSSTRPESAYTEHNTLATLRILDALDRSGVHLVHASTSSVYGEYAIGDESQPLEPVSAYGRSKVAAEQHISERARDGRVTATILRLFSVYGPDQRPDMAYAKACRALIDGDVMQITGDGSQKRSNTYIGDVAAAALLAVQLRPQATMNISGSESIALLDAVDILASALGVATRVEFVPSVAGDQRSTAGDSSRARAKLGWVPTTTLALGLEAQASWFRERVAVHNA